MMQKGNILFLIVSSLVGIGILLSFYSTQIIFEDLIKGEGFVKPGADLIVEAEIDNIKIKHGIYAIQIINFKEGVISAKVLDPSEIEILSQLINKESFEGTFDISNSGVYKLFIENSGETETQIFGVIGPEPDAGKKSLSFISMYIIIIGLIGMVGVIIYLIKSRKKSFS